MSILEQYGKLPSVEDMMAALASPVVPKGAVAVEDEMTTDEMIREMFSLMKSGSNGNIVAIGSSGGGGSPGTYDGV